MNLRSIDLNLFVIFEAIMSQRTVSGAADRVGLSPSAVSHALRRLRVMFNDELFRRTARGLEPTDHAVHLSEEIAKGLRHIETALEQQQRFDPAHAKRTFTIQIADYVSGYVLPRLAERLRREAPGIAVRVEPFSARPDDPADADAQIRLTWGEKRPIAARAKRLLTDTFLVIMRRDHPAIGTPMTVEHYAGLNHLKVSPTAVGTTIIDDALRRRGLRRNVILVVPSWFEIPAIIERTDLVAVVPNRWHLVDDRLSRFAYAPLPLEEVRFTIDLCWDARRERDAGQKWFRTMIAGIFADYSPAELHGAHALAPL